jgi:hypothetical protein
MLPGNALKYKKLKIKHIKKLNGLLIVKTIKKNYI